MRRRRADYHQGQSIALIERPDTLMQSCPACHDDSLLAKRGESIHYVRVLMNPRRNIIQRGKRNRILARVLFWLGVIGFVSLTSIAYFAPSFYESLKPIGFYWVFPCWTLVLLSGLYLHNAKCPRCGHRFSVTKDGFFWNDFADRCLNCGLSLRGDDA